MLQHSLQAIYDNPDLLLDQWELEPLTPLSTPSHSPPPSPRSFSSPHLPQVEESLPVIDPERAAVGPTRGGPRAAPLAEHPGRTRAQAGKQLRRRTARKKSANPFDRKLKSSTSGHVAGTGMLKSSMAASSFPIARGAYVGIRQDGIEKGYWTLERVKAQGFKVKKWDGR